jgi:hypothetical protein
MLKSYNDAVENGNINGMLLLGSYYKKINNDQLMKKYFKLGHENGCLYSTCQLGLYYNDNKNYEKMKKYYMIAVEKNNLWGIELMGSYYGYINDIEMMKKYYMMILSKQRDIRLLDKLKMKYQNFNYKNYQIPYIIKNKDYENFDPLYIDKIRKDQIDKIDLSMYLNFYEIIKDNLDIMMYFINTKWYLDSNLLYEVIINDDIKIFSFLYKYYDSIKLFI